MITIQKSVLSRAVGVAAKAVSPNPVIPLLSNVLFESNNGNSRIAGTNFEIGISYSFLSSGDEFKVCLPAKTMTGLVEALHSEQIELELNESNQSIIVTTDTSTSSVRFAPADEFPDIPKVTRPDIVLPVVGFKEAVQRVAFASNAEEKNNSILGGVQISIDEGKLVLFATDGFHLSYEEIAVGKGIPDMMFIAKGTTLETISRILPDEGELEIQVEQNKALFHCGEVDVVTQLLDGRFPDYKLLQQAIPEPTTTLTLSTLELLRAAKQLKVFTPDTGASKMEVLGILVKYSTLARDRGDSDINLYAIRKGADVAVGLNVFLLYEFLEICKTPQVTIELAGPAAPIVFKMEGFKAYYHVIMPIVL